MIYFASNSNGILRECKEVKYKPYEKMQRCRHTIIQYRNVILHNKSKIRTLRWTGLDQVVGYHNQFDSPSRTNLSGDLLTEEWATLFSSAGNIGPFLSSGPIFSQICKFEANIIAFLGLDIACGPYVANSCLIEQVQVKKNIALFSYLVI